MACITHHHACECREKAIAELLKAVQSCNEDALCFGTHTEDCKYNCYIADEDLCKAYTKVKRMYP